MKVEYSTSLIERIWNIDQLETSKLQAFYYL